MRTAGCFMEHGGKFIILLRHPKKIDGGKWALPAGKIEQNESNEDAIVREIEEETGYKATKDELEFLGTNIFKYPHLHVEFPTFRIKLKNPIQVRVNPNEHTAWKWVSAEECYNMPGLIRGFQDLLKRTGYIA